MQQLHYHTHTAEATWPHVSTDRIFFNDRKNYGNSATLCQI